MARYTFGAYETQAATAADFGRFIEVVKGRSIISLADWGPERLELGLSGNVMLRVFATGAEIEVNCISTQNPEEPPAFALTLGEMPATVPVWQLDIKLRGLRTAFAIFYLLTNKRAEELADYLSRHPSGDVDRALLSSDEALQVESVSYGSWVATVRAKTRGAIDALTALATIVFPRTRNAFLKKLEAEADLKSAEARRGEVALERERFALAKDRTDYVLDLANKIEDPEAKEILIRRLRGAIYELASGDQDEPEIRTSIRRLLSAGQAGREKKEEQ